MSVTPYLNIDIEDEYSLSERLTNHEKKGILDVAVIRLPHISNFTDFLMLEHEPHIYLSYVEQSSQLGTPDLIILPGTKNTMDDPRWLRTSGLEAVMKKAHESGSILFGICGGYQMLGSRLSDPEHVEAGGELAGLGYLSMQTVFTKEKTRTRVRGKVAPICGALAELSGCGIEGYEIHMGETIVCGEFADGRIQMVDAGLRDDEMCEAVAKIHPLTALTDETHAIKKTDGAASATVYGTYVHGFFDSEGVTGALACALAKQRGITLEQTAGKSLSAYREEQFELLAASLREHLDMEYIYQLIGKK